MEIVKQTDNYKVFKKKSGRFGVKNAKGKWVNADEKVKILLAEGLIKVTAPKAPTPEETTTEEVTE